MKTSQILGGSLLSLTLSLFAPLVGASPVIILPSGSDWRYLADGTDPGSAWRGAAFNDSAWGSGAAQLGFGDGDEVTTLQSGIITAYFRHTFQSQITGASSLTLRLLRDDGAVVYINGVEVFRNNMPPGAVSYSTLATVAVGGAEETTQFVTTQIDPGLLVQGMNVVAVEVHQVNVTSSDLSFDLELIAEAGPAFPTVNVVATDSDAAESGLLTAIFPGRFTFYRTPVNTNVLIVNYALTGTAANGTDYQYISNQVRFNPGQAEVRVDVIPLNDNLVEGTENVVVTLVPPPCAFIIPPPSECFQPGPSNRAEVFIKDANAPPENQQPYVQLNEPANGGVFKAPTNIVLRAFAHDPEDGYRVSVEFFANGNSVGFGTFEPATCPAPYCPYYQLIWSNPPAGNYILSARATDSLGASTNSASVSIVVRSPDTDTNAALVAFGSVWKYLDNGTDQGTAWREPGFDDSTWAAGPAQLGYGDGDEITVVNFGPDPANKYITTYFRRSFQVVNAANITDLRGRLLQDDGGVVYLNGMEIFRSNLPSGPIAFNTLALVTSPDNQIVDFAASPALLREGINIVAVEMHQNSPVSSDISFDLELIGQRGTPPPELPVVNVIATDSDAAESGVLAAIFPGTFTFSRSGSVTNGLTAFFTLSGSAENGVDYRYVSNSVHFNPGQAQARVDIYPQNDGLFEGTENVLLALQVPICATVFPPPAGCYRVGPSNRAEVFIRDADSRPNQRPYVQLNEPHNGDVFQPPTNVTLRAFATDQEDGYQLRVEFFDGTISLGLGEFAPTRCPTPYCPFYELVWANPPPGDHTLIARATDSLGASSNSAPVNITVRGLAGPLNPAPDSQEWPAVASDGVNYFAVWMDRRNHRGDYDVYGARISAAGEVLDREGIPICTDVSWQWYPSVAFDGNNFLVVWSDQRDNVEGTPRLEIYGARVGRDGRVLDTNGFKITHDEIAYQPTVAFNGSTYLVAAYARQHNGQVGDTAIAVRVTPAGVVLDTEEIVLFGPKSTLSPVVVASVGGNWLAAWNYAGIQASLVRPDGSVGLPSYIGSRGDTWMRGLTAVGNNYFLTMRANRQLSSATSVMDIYGTWIDSAGQPFKTVLVSSNTSPAGGSSGGQPTIYLQDHATAAGIGNEALVIWEAGAVYTNGGNQRWTSDIRAARVTATGNVSTPFTICSAPQDQALPSLAFSGQQFFAVWEDARSALPYEENPFGAYDIYGTRVTMTGSVVEPNGFLISSAGSNRAPQVSITVPADGTMFDQGPTIRIEAVTVDPDGFASTVEFFADDQKIGETTLRPAQPGQPLRFEFDWANAPVGQHRLTARTVDNAGARATSVPVNITVREPDNHELHIVGIYAAASTAAHEEGHATVFVDRPGKLVTVFLSAYEPVLWSISASTGTTIERVYLVGYYPGRAEGIGPEVEVIGEWINYYIGTSLVSGQFYRTAPKVRRLTGLEISSFHGDSTAVVIDSVQDDPRLLANYPVPTPLSELPDLSFTISFYSGAGIFGVDYSLAGPNDGGDLLPRSERALLANDGTYYALGDNGLLQFDPVSGTTRELPVPSNLPEVSVPVGIAYDSLRDRALLVTLGGEGFLYAYSPASGWSVLSSMNGLDLASLAYHANDDSFYGVAMTFAEANALTLYRFTATGTGAGELRLPLYPWGADMNSSQLVSVGEYLVLLMNPSYYTGDLNHEDEESRMYLINPATGEAWLTARQPKSISPNQPPRVSITAPTNGAVFPAPASIQITAVAEGTTSYATKVEFFANGRKIGETMIPPETGGNIFRFTWQNVQPGAYALTAKATDFRDGVGISAPVNIRVGPELPPPACACDAPWRNHREYVSCVIRHAWALYRSGEITEAQRRNMIHDAVLSDCGKHPLERERAYVHLLPLSREECRRDGMQFVLSGDVTGPCFLECSEDLVNWRIVEPVSITGWEIACPMDAGTRARFYHVRAE